MNRFSRPMTALIKSSNPKSSTSLLRFQSRFGGGGHIDPRDRNSVTGLNGPCPGVDYNANEDDNPFLWDPHYAPQEESDFDRFTLEQHEKGRYAIPDHEIVRKLQKESVLKRVESVIRRMERAQCENKSLHMMTHLYNDLALDSLDAVEFGLHLETEFEVELLDEEAEQVVTVGDAVALICDHPNAV